MDGRYCEKREREREKEKERVLGKRDQKNCVASLGLQEERQPEQESSLFQGSITGTTKLDNTAPP